jgi:Mrp family chromosome partitioning ATPase
VNKVQPLVKEMPALNSTAPAAGAVEQSRITSIRERAAGKPSPMTASVCDEQIQALVQQLFFRHETPHVRHVGFAPVDVSTGTATLCLAVARALAADDKYDVALIDARSESVCLYAELGIPAQNRVGATSMIEPRLWIVPRQSWLPDTDQGRITDQSLSRLRDLTADFDFSILWCDPVSWLTTSIGQNCDGLVLVLAANSTRRMVALQIKDQLERARVSLLGTVLAERQFPVPQSLYRSL